MLHLNKYLVPIFHPGFHRNDGVVGYVQESVENEVVCTKAKLHHRIIKAKYKNNQCFVVFCMYITPCFENYLFTEAS